MFPSVWVVVVISIGIGMLVGLTNGLLIAKLNLAPFIVTLGMLYVARGLTEVLLNGQNITNELSGQEGLGNTGFFEVFASRPLGLPISAWVMILFAITLVFAKTTETVAIQEARTAVYTNARYALDIMENDFMGVLPFDPPPLPIQPAPGVAPAPQPGFQAFWMENGQAVAGQMPTNVGGGHDKQSGDIISFRATTTVGDTLQTVQVTYMIIPRPTGRPPITMAITRNEEPDLV
jgi:hypothetical protein